MDLFKKSQGMNNRKPLLCKILFPLSILEMLLYLPFPTIILINGAQWGFTDPYASTTKAVVSVQVSSVLKTSHRNLMFEANFVCVIKLNNCI